MRDPDVPTISVVTVEDRVSNFIRLVADLMPRGRHVQPPPMPATMVQTMCLVGADGELVTTVLPSREALAWAARLARDCFHDPARSYRLMP